MYRNFAYQALINSHLLCYLNLVRLLCAKLEIGFSTSTWK